MEEEDKDNHVDYIEARTYSFEEAYKIPSRESKIEYPFVATLALAYQSLGVVYGDLGTSPLYVFPSVSLSNPAREDDILGILSLIFWTLTSIALFKYIIIVLHADDHGEGGTFALYSLLCRHMNFQGKIGIQSSRLASDINLKFYSSKTAVLQSKTKEFFEKSPRAQSIFTFIVLLATCMVIGDGALTPAISVLSAVQGIQSRSEKITQNYVVIISVVILLVVFMLQRFGTDKVSFIFSPIMLLWFTSMASIGIYNTIQYYPSVFKFISPYYIYYFFKRNGKEGWERLGSVALCITGAEATFADLGHFNKRSIQLAFSFLVYPALVITYGGQGAFLIKNPDKISTAFYSSIPRPVFWPMFVIATLAAVVASQSLISASFSIIKQSLALNCFPRVNIIHTSRKHEGQIYSPEVNYILMISCVLIVVGFKGGAEIGNAFGVAVIWVMLITTCLMAVVMLVIWKTNLILIVLFFTVFFFIEASYMTSLLIKVPQGGWVSFAIAVFFLTIMLSWTYGRSKKKAYEAERKMSKADLTELVSRNVDTRVPGICLFCTDLINGVPPIIRHYVQNVGTLREVLIVVTVRTLPIVSVLPEERFIVGTLGPYGVYRCLVQYGYKDVPNLNGDDFVTLVVDKLKEVIENYNEIQHLESAASVGVVYVMGRTVLVSSEKNGWLAHLVIDYFYRFLQKNFRSAVSTLNIPPSKMLQVGVDTVKALLLSTMVLRMSSTKLFLFKSGGSLWTCLTHMGRRFLFRRNGNYNDLSSQSDKLEFVLRANNKGEVWVCSFKSNQGFVVVPVNSDATTNKLRRCSSSPQLRKKKSLDVNTLEKIEAAGKMIKKKVKTLAPEVPESSSHVSDYPHLNLRREVVDRIRSLSASFKEDYSSEERARELPNSSSSVSRMRITDSSCGGGGGGLDEDLFGDPKSWPPGFRFSPTDEELILYYLKRKICRRRLKLNVIKETDVYKWDPEELPGQSILKNGDRQWYFFTPRDRKYPNAARSNRATRQGYWKATGKDRTVTWNSRSVGVKKTLVFYKGRAPSGERTDWVMHEYTMEENELQRCKNVQNYYALYKVFKKSGPGPKNGEQYGAPFREEDWADDDELVENNAPNEVTQVLQNGSSCDNSFNPSEPLVDDLDELLRRINDEPGMNQLPNSEDACEQPQIGAQKETPCTMMGTSHGEVIPCEPVSWYPQQNQFEEHGSFSAVQSPVSYLPSGEAPEVTSTSNYSEPDFHRNEGVNYLELDDLEGSQHLEVSSLIGAEGDSLFQDMDGLIGAADSSLFQDMDALLSATDDSLFQGTDGLNGSDLYFDAAVFFQDFGTINQSLISAPFSDGLCGNLSTRVACEAPTHVYDAGQISGGQLWMQEQRYNVSMPAESNQVAMDPPTSASIGIMRASSSTDLGKERQNLDDDENDDIGSWFNSAISSLLGSVPARPALASENTLINRAFERMSSFGRVSIAATDSGAATTSGGTFERRVGRNGGLFFFSVLGLLCAALWMLMIGTTLKVLKNFFGRFISS
ncbi:Low affinity potassium transport system protein kup [Thalictrum thalictroides]|uniref:Potassium transporter n=1 Tax=Thalictrum thalictroides TaxID=46969 RepID=A0A7J6VWU7_THATH|nr:Low affinity potassium transport system protein kup [Thalictrum thalictroides]